MLCALKLCLHYWFYLSVQILLCCYLYRDIQIYDLIDALQHLCFHQIFFENTNHSRISKVANDFLKLKKTEFLLSINTHLIFPFLRWHVM